MKRKRKISVHIVLFVVKLVHLFMNVHECMYMYMYVHVCIWIWMYMYYMQMHVIVLIT